MSGARKRRGTTLVELSLVIAILAMVALPFAAFVSQNLKNTVQSSTQLKEQMVLEQVMQDMEKHLRSAIRVKSDGTSCPITFPPGGISFTSSDPQKVVSTRPVQTQYTYVLASGLLTKIVGTNVGVTFPDGLEASLITKLKFWSTTTEPPDAATPEPPDAATPPCYLTVRMEAYNPTLQTTTALQETIYLRNYTLIVDIAKILGVTAPVPGATPTPAIAATSEYAATISWSGSPVTFAAGTPYTATITLTPTGDYTLTGVAADFFTVDGAASVTNPAGSGTTTAIVVTATFPAIGATQLAITAPALTLSKPYDGTTTAAVTAGTLIGVVSPDVVTVTAVATYDTAAAGAGKTITVVYSLAGADAAKYVKPVDYTVSTGEITLVPIDIAAILGVTVPVQNVTPLTTITPTNQYTGTVVWAPALIGQEKFKNQTVYTATITIVPKPGYTLTGVAANFFTVDRATTVTNPVDSGVVTAIFPKT
jgi:Tfp pilus assembly protein PilE